MLNNSHAQAHNSSTSAASLQVTTVSRTHGYSSAQVVQGPLLRVCGLHQREHFALHYLPCIGQLNRRTMLHHVPGTEPPSEESSPRADL